jgi:tetratricopeptide (TPR) repeat protein
MGSHHRSVTTSSPLAQQYFDQGLVWAYAFNHDEAIRSFEKATRLDPECAMAWWGIALCNGPHINNPIVPPHRSEAAWEALQRAVALRENTTPTERALIGALSTRYTDPPPADRRPLDEAYAKAMREVWLTYSDDSDVGTLCAEALMDLRPWDLWTKDGRPQPGTEEIIDILEDVLRLDPGNPGANHLYVHAVEASPHPERANAAADRLRGLVPGSGHLVHMPSHIDVLTGRWALASQQNELAIQADREYRAISPKQGFYRLYMAHNHHMLSFASMMEGRSKVAIRSAREVVESVPEDYLRRETALMDPYMGAVYDALKRFGRWDDILREPAPPSYLPITTAMWRFNRGVAYTAKGEVQNAEREQAAFREAVSNVPEDAVMAINPAKNVLQIAAHFLQGEIAFRRGDMDEAVNELRKAIALEDDLLYMEPPEWVQPTRHTLGAVLLSAARYEEAERVYREDLSRWPENGWSLYGLARCLRARGEKTEAEAVEARFRKVWARADARIGSSCLCVPNT